MPGNKIRQWGAGRDKLAFYCPGCKCTHVVTINPTADHKWTWNGSLDRPTFTPSVLCSSDVPEIRCHSFVTEGQIQFLDDSYHHLKGQTVELPNWED